MSGISSRQAGVVVSYIYSIVQIAVQLIYVPLLLSGIGQSEYGVYQFVGSILAYLTVINTVLASGITKFYSRAVIEGDEVKMENTLAVAKRLHWAISAIAIIIILVVGAVVVNAYRNSFSSPQLNEMSLMFIVLAIDMVVTMNNTINIAVITAHERFVFLKISQLVAVMMQPIMVLVGMQILPTAFMVALCTLCSNIICALIQRVFAQNVLKAKYTFHHFDKQLVGEMLSFSTAVVLVAFSDQVFWKSGQLILGYFYGPDLIAVFAIGAQVYSVYVVVGTTVSTVFLPRVTEIHLTSANPIRGFTDLFIKVGRIALYVSLFILMAFAIFGKEFICLWAGDGFEEAYWVALIVMVPYTVDIIQNLGLTILQVVNRYQFRGYMNAAISIVNVLLSIWLVQNYDILGAAISTASAILLGNCLLMNLYYSKVIGIDIRRFWNSIFRILGPLCAAGVFAYLLWGALGLHGWVALIAGGLLFTLLYGAVAIHFCFDGYERTILKRLCLVLGNKVS